MKEVKLRRLNDAVLFEGTDQQGARVLIDGSAKVGGRDAAPTPTSILLMSLGGCTGIDVVSILAKMKQPLEDIEIEIRGEQREEVPTIFTKIHVHYKLKGNLKPEKVERAIELSREKYCTITKMIDSVATIESSYEILSGDEE